MNCGGVVLRSVRLLVVGLKLLSVSSDGSIKKYTLAQGNVATAQPMNEATSFVPPGRMASSTARAFTS